LKLSESRLNLKGYPGMEELIEKKIYQAESLKIIKGENYKIVVS